MKNIQNFEDFVNESILNEGAMADKGYKQNMKDGLETLKDRIANSEPGEDDEWKAIAAALKADPKDVVQVDSESNDDHPTYRKIYNYLERSFSGSVPVDAYNQMGQDCTLDPNLNVVRIDDYGFVGFFFTAKSNF